MKKHFPVYFLTVTLLMLLAVSSRAQDTDILVGDSDDRPSVVDKGTVKEILDSDMIELSNDRRYKLDNILMPPYEDQPAMDELNKLVLGKLVTILVYPNPDEKPQHGLPAVQVITDKNVWVQEDLVAKGLAWAYSSDTNEQMIYPLKVVEDNARIQKVGFWKDPVYAIKTPSTVKNFMNSYQIVEGKILSTNVRASGTTFLNFGKNWKTDFEVRVKGSNDFLGLVNDPRAPKNKKALTKEEAEVQNRGFNPQQWEGRIVRVRGWVHGSDGPMIDLAHREQIDFIDGPPAAAGK
jgi:micrococcal nuclease